MIERGYRHEDDATREEIVARFAERTAEYDAKVRRVANGDLPGAIQEALQRRGVRRLVVPPYLPKEWIPEGLETLHDVSHSRLTEQELDESDGVLTGCALGIAQTGTIVLDSGRAQGRRALTLLPDYHLCVVREEQILGLVPEAIAKLEGMVKGKGRAITEAFAGLKRTVKGEGRAITFISGPSATSDIELNRVEGVHGPRTLEVLISG
jgi:L-lactate dehydrogenase complex protein LldG